MTQRIIKLAFITLFIVVGCQPPTEVSWDNLTGRVVSEISDSLGFIEVFSSSRGYTSKYDYSADYRNIYASTFTMEDNSYTLKEGFPVDLILETSLFGCSQDDSRVTSARNVPFILSFVHATRDTYSVLILDTTGMGGGFFPAADTNNIDQIIMGNNAIFGEPGTARTIPQIVLQNAH